MIVSLVRHAQTHINPNLPAKNWSLTPDGLKAAQQLSQDRLWSNLDRIITSQEKKAILTASYIAKKHHLKFEMSAKLNEVRRGGFISNYEERVKLFFNNPSLTVDEWETANSAQKRGIDEVNRLLSQSSSTHVAIVGHGLLFSLIRAYWLKQSLVNINEWKAIRMPDVSTWRISGDDIDLMSDFKGIQLQ